MKKITILALHLNYGGIEKCIADLANSICDNYNIEIISTYKMTDKPAFEINSKVDIKYLITDLKPNKQEVINCLKKFKLVSLVKELVKSRKVLKLKKNLMIDYIKQCDSDIIISTRDIHNLWLGKYGRKDALKIGWEHNYHNNNHKYINKVIKSVLNLDYFVLVSNTLKDFYEGKTGNCKCVFIPNSITNIPQKQSNLEGENIISVGRLSKEKGYLDLIDVFKIVHDFYPTWKLNIIGDGSEKNKIEERIHSYNLDKNVCLHGFRDLKYIQKMSLDSSMYVMTSFTEAFGLVLIEASSLGLPCIAFDSATGAREIIKDNWDGYLVKSRDKEQMAKRIISLIKNKNRRIIMGNNAYKKSLNFLADNIKEKWINLFEEK